MKKINVYKLSTVYVFLLLFIGTQILACKTAPNQAKRERTLPAFNELSLCISADVILTQGPVQKVDIQASERLLKLIETEVTNGKLTIKWSEKFVRNTENIKIYVTMMDVNGLHVSGSGDILASGPISSANIDLSVSGSGDIKLDNLKADNLKSSISGSADIVVSGASPANSLEASISGSGDIMVQGIPAKNVDIRISGSGNCTVNATESLKARVSGSGDIFYSGTATIDAKVSGSGSVQHVN